MSDDAKLLPGPYRLSDMEWEVIKEAVACFDAPSPFMAAATIELHHKLRKLNDRQVVTLVLDRNPGHQ